MLNVDYYIIVVSRLLQLRKHAQTKSDCVRKEKKTMPTQQENVKEFKMYIFTISLIHYLIYLDIPVFFKVNVVVKVVVW